jgi:hypothetical protein
MVASALTSATSIATRFGKSASRKLQQAFVFGFNRNRSNQDYFCADPSVVSRPSVNRLRVLRSVAILYGMPATVLKKAVLKDGDYHSPDGVVNVTPERRRHWANSFQKMREAGAHIPVAWDHGTNEEELSPTEGDRSAANTIGELVDIVVTDDGIEFSVQVSDPHAIGRAERNEVYVSPVIFPNWKNSHGHEFSDCITHVDLVNHPVDHSQGPFVTVTQEPGIVACCLRMGLSTNVYTKAIRMAKSEDDHYYGNKADIENHDGSGKGPKKARGKKARGGRKGKRKMSLVRMGGDNTDDEEKKDTPEGDDSPADEKSDDSPAETMADEANGESDGYDSIDEILDMLEEFKIALPDDTDDSNLLDRLRTALHVAIAHKGGGDDEAPVPGADDQMQVASPMMQTMSLQSKTAFLFAEKIHRDNIQRDLKQLLADGKCTPVEIKERESSLKAIKLSLDDQGNTKPSDVEKWIASRQPVPKGTFWDASQRLSLQVIDQPADLNGGLTPEQAQATADWALGKKK